MDGAVLRQLGTRLAAGDRVFALAGTTGGAKALSLAKAILSENRSYAVIVPSSADSRSLAEELEFYCRLLFPAPPEIIHLPGFEVDPYRGMSPHPEIAAARARALWQLLDSEQGDRRKVLVTSARAAAIRLHAPERFLNCCLTLRQDEDMSPELIRDHLRESGYVEDDPVTDPGEFSLRGGILDVFSPNMERPVRLEFFGDTIESIRSFDSESQRSVEAVRHIEIVPMREYCVREDALRDWAEKAHEIWSPPFLKHIEEELALASHGELFPAFEFLLPASDPLDKTLFDYLRGFRIAVLERENLVATLDRRHEEIYGRFVDRVEAQKAVLEPKQIYMETEELMTRLDQFPRLEIEELNVSAGEAASVFLSSQPVRKYHGNIRELIGDIRKSGETGEKVVFVLSNIGRAERIFDILKEYEIPARLCRPDAQEHPVSEATDAAPQILIGVGGLHHGCFLPAENLRILTTPEIFDETDSDVGTKKSKSAKRNPFISDFRDLKPGDYVVHVDHGIGMFHGLRTIGLDAGAKEFVLLTYHGDAKLYVPVERLDLIQKYSGMGAGKPTLDRLGGASWERTKKRIKKSMRDMAEELLKLYAQRQTVSGYAFSPDTAWQREFEDAFEFELTRDQADALEAVKADMESPRPMDRLLCGDVGYGKTEVAVRAAFKAVMDGKQVALLAPTTVLAFQHYNTLLQRFTAFPVRTQLLSRFRNPKEQKQILADLESGQVDLVVGTHRLLSKDVAFKDLGLVIVDEEQRFGVTHKERLKALKTRVDVLTLTATPIPRTLNMALLGMRDMSTIETPPKNRLAIQTSVLKHSSDVIRSAIEMELARGGQVYYLHNRVETIHSVAARVQQLVPSVRIGVAHGQMKEQELEQIMMKFVRDELNVLVATTIIENGLDIPKANTLIVDRADLYGLSQLYQLRGRVGRSDRRAYAYLLIPSDEVLSEVARKRLAAIREFSDLGMGFRVAALDLEIRGAGNLLGGEQHGHIEAVGFDLYCQLLERTVEELRGEAPEEEISTAINLNLDIRIPEDYIADAGQRLRMYKRISSAGNGEELDGLRQEITDRYGRYPEPVENLFRYARLRQETLALQIQSVERNKNQVFLRFADSSKVDVGKLLKLLKRDKRATFSPQGLLTLDLPKCPPEQLFEAIHATLEKIRP
ncbi:MAG: transcription-repair coupling factor [Acidobacteriota bacterium]|nr:transcription-repair coupling factor [Acidobacteriota bacterium]